MAYQAGIAPMECTDVIASDPKTLEQSGDVLLRREAAAQVLNTTPGTLAVWACKRQGPPFLKIGKRAVRYRLSDLQEWLKSCEVKTNSVAAG